MREHPAGGVMIRNPAYHWIGYATAEEWAAFVAGVKNGDFDATTPESASR